MSYVGNTPTQQAFTPAVDYFNGTGSQTAFTLSRPVASVAQVEVIVNNVAQNPGSTYTVSGNTITFVAAPSAGTNNIYVYYTSPITQVQALTQNPSVIGPMYVAINGATPLGGATNPIIGASGSANNYVQSYVLNQTNGANSSADFTAYPSNGADAAGWVDMGITGPSFSQAAYSVTGPNEAYLFGSAPSGSGTTGNLVIATDSTGTTNAIQFYNGGFNKAKGAQSATISANGLGLGTAVAASGVGVAFPATQSASSDANTLDDYEEGAWTPIVGGNATYTNQVGTYTKVGNRVAITGHLTILSIGTGSTGTISGLPFTHVSNGLIDTVSFGYFGGLSTSLTFLTAYISSNAATITFAGTSTAQATIGNAIAVMTSGTDLYFSATYQTA